MRLECTYRYKPAANRHVFALKSGQPGTVPSDYFLIGITMGMFSFIKEAGEKLFGHGDAKAAQVAVAAAPTPENIEALSKAAGDAIATYIGTMNLKVEALDIAFNASTGTVTVSGVAPDQETKEKVLLCCGNVASVASVNDMMTVSIQEPESQMYIVVIGDNLSKVSKQFYGTPNKYTQIFEANKPMLTHPDKIYPGQVLRIPAAT
jgi:nucleoid-associated protein YgaU